MEIEFSRKYLGIIYIKEKNEGTKIYTKIFQNLLNFFNLNENEEINELDILNLFGNVVI